VKLHAQRIQGRYARKGSQPIFILSKEEGVEFQLKTIYVDQPPYVPGGVLLADLSDS
jgi:hypothetical protein